MENKLKQLFAYQKFMKNKNLNNVIEKTKSSLEVLDEASLAAICAAGEIKEEEKKDKEL